MSASNAADLNPAKAGGPPAPLAVDARRLSVRRGGTEILRDFSCRLRRGELTALLGANGCGKTTFVRTLLGVSFFAPGGSLAVLGETVGECDMRALRKRIGLVSPAADGEGRAMGYSVDTDLPALEAVCTGFFGTIGLYDRPSPAQQAEAARLLERVGLGHRLFVPVTALSSGEQRKCLIARALALKPELLLLDEPTAGLDLRAREQVLATIDQLLKGDDAPAILLVTHHAEELIPATKHVIVMHEGRTLAEGAPTEVLTNETLGRAFGCKVHLRRSGQRFYTEVLPEAWLEM